MDRSLVVDPNPENRSPATVGDTHEPGAALVQFQRRGLKLAAAFGGILVAVLSILVWNYRRPLPVLTPDRYRRALETWDRNEPHSYRIEIQVFGRQAASYAVEVRDGETRHASRNGQPLKQHRPMATWSVPGMFDTISSDLDNQEKHASGTAGPETPNVALRCVFDSHFGFPSRYHRHESLPAGGSSEVSWEVKRFEPL